MKKILILFTTLLVLAGILIGLYLYLWTPENFAKLGEKALAEEDYKDALKYYEIAFDLQPENKDYAMALVKTYTLQQNYTKAERTLVQAIKAIPSADLYCKLSELYILQNKVLDSQLMLDTIIDPAIRAEVESLRPAAPVFDPAPGSYDDYIEVTIKSTGGKIYYSMTGDYPSSHSDPFSAPIALEAGKTHMQAIVVGDNGLASPIVEAAYDIVGVVEELQFESPELEEMIRTDLYISRTSPILSSDLWNIESLILPTGVTTLADLRHFPALKELSLQGCSIEDFSVLQELPYLEVLDAGGSLISAEALEQIGCLVNLKILRMGSCGLSGIRPLAALTALETLDLSGNSISDLSPLSGLTAIKTLDLRSNAITDLQALSALTTLQEFYVSNNKVSTLAPLQKNVHMQILYAENNELMSVGALGHMADLSIFVANNNLLEDISALGNCTRMTRLEVGNNFLTSVDCMGKMPLLTYLDINHNQVLSLPELQPTFHLQRFYAAYNQLSSVAPLAGLPELTYVDVDYNEQIEDIQVLSSCHMLVQVNAFGTHVIEVTLLTDYGVIVNYDPSFADQDPSETEED